MTTQLPITLEATNLMALIMAFGVHLQEETAALRRADFATVEKLQQGKKNFAKDYHAQVTAFAARRDEIANLDVATREKIVRMRIEFTNTLNDNTRALESARDSAKRLVNRILDAARQAVVDDAETNYSSKGKAQAYKTSMLSLSVDQRL